MQESMFNPRKEARKTIATYYWTLLQDGEFPQHFDKVTFYDKVSDLVADEVFEGILTIKQAYLVLKEIRDAFSSDSDD